MFRKRPPLLPAHVTGVAKHTASIAWWRDARTSRCRSAIAFAPGRGLVEGGDAGGGGAERQREPPRGPSDGVGMQIR